LEPLLGSHFEGGYAEAAYSVSRLLILRRKPVKRLKFGSMLTHLAVTTIYAIIGIAVLRQIPGVKDFVKTLLGTN
jgi:hypothetical protein